jgi:hypothetical protein
MYTRREKQRGTLGMQPICVYPDSHIKKPGELALTGPKFPSELSQGFVGSAGFASLAGIEAVSGGLVSVELAFAAGLEASLL